MMAGIAVAELTVAERGILATSASAAHLDSFSHADRVPVSEFQQPVCVSRKRTYYSRGRTYVFAWQDNGQPLPGWFDPLMQGFVDLLTLPANWDSYGAGVIDTKLVDEAIDITNALLGPNAPPPRVIPLSSGGLQLEWHRHGIDLEIVFDRDDEPFFYYRNRASGEECEQGLREGRVQLRTLIAKLE